MFAIEKLHPLLPFSWSSSRLRAEDAEYLEYYGIHFPEQQAKGMRYHFGQKGLAGFTIALHYLEIPNPKGSVVLLHGYMDHVGLYNHLIKALLESGYSVLAFDLPGHGLSSGEQVGIDDFSDYQKVLQELMLHAKKQLPKPWYLVGQSTGGAIAMDYLMNNPEHGFAKAVLLAPLVIPKRWKLVRLQLALLGWLLRRVPRQFVKNSSDAQFLYFLHKQDPLQTRFIAASWVKALLKWQNHFAESPGSDTPVLVVQGGSDVTVEWTYNLPRIRAKFTSCKEVMLPEANHHLVKEAEPLRSKVLGATLEFLAA
jgi:alpha-beta hydrolase superfamily lysophospholipase